MKTKQDYLQDLTDIRSIMHKATRFQSLSGWSGILAGLYALTGAFTAHIILDNTPLNGISDAQFLELGVTGLLVLLLALGTAVVLSVRKGRSLGHPLWNAITQKLILNMGIPLVTGGFLILILVNRSFLELVIPVMLLFYGLALVNAAQRSFEELRFMGILEIALGLAAAWSARYALLFWAIGFGILHLVFGLMIHLKYDR